VPRERRLFARAGIFVNGGSFRIANNTLFANQAKGGSSELCFGVATSTSAAGGDAAGGGLYISSGGVSLTGDTVTSNLALTGFGNRGSSSGGGIANAGATSLVTNTTLIGNNPRTRVAPATVTMFWARSHLRTR